MTDNQKRAAVGTLVRVAMIAAVILVGLSMIGRNMATPFSIADQVAQVRSSVVHILKKGDCQGSGCLILPDVVFTAKHVSDDIPGDYTVTLDDGREFPVKYVIEDKENDVTFMQLDLGDSEPDLPTVELAPSDDLRIGDFVFIMGSPLGKDNFNTASLGILSALDRNLYDRSGWDRYKKYDWHVMMQTTSPAYPGNSGGPVFDLNGRVVGVLVAGYDATFNFAVPVCRFRDTLDTVRDWFRLCRFNVVDEEKPPVTLNLNIYEERQQAVYPCH